MPRVLAIDTTGDVCSVALSGPGVELSFHESLPRQHAKRVLPIIQQLFDQAGWQPGQLDFVVYGRGPGSFTGIRIAAGIAQGIALGADCGVVPVSTLETLVFEVQDDAPKAAPVWAAIDARMQEIYLGCYRKGDQGLPELIEEERLLKPECLSEPPDTVMLVGNGWLTDYGFGPTWQRLVSQQSITARLPRASVAASLASRTVAQDDQAILPPELALPTYLRDKVTWDKPGKK